jgi:tetratricopeptide (TPR) repeat protein
MPISLTNNTEGEYYPPQLLSQKLNNRSAYHITTGNYEEAIKLLTKALKLTETKEGGGEDDANKPRCNCKACTLESCLIMEHDAFMSLLMTDQQEQQQEAEQQEGHQEEGHQEAGQQEGQQEGQQKQHEHSSSSSSSSSSDEITTSSPPLKESSSKESSKESYDDNNDDEGFVYRRPLLVNKHCIEEMHNMGITLSLIILFNLALAHHLKAITSFTASKSSSTAATTTTATTTTHAKNKLQVLQQALQLYELAYQLRVDYIQQSQQEELNQPSNSNSNGSTNSDTDNDTDDITNNNDEYNRSMVGSLRFTMIVSNNLGEIHRAAGNTEKHTMCLQHLLSAMMYMVDSDLLVLDSIGMDGFYSNVAPIMGLKKKGVFAQAA